MGLTSMESLDDFIQTNRQNYERYQEGLADVAGARLVPFAKTEKHNYQYIVLEIDEATIGMSRDELVGINAGIVKTCCEGDCRI